MKALRLYCAKKSIQINSTLVYFPLRFLFPSSFHDIAELSETIVALFKKVLYVFDGVQAFF